MEEEVAASITLTHLLMAGVSREGVWCQAIQR